jgi:Helix-turn-helix domain
MIAQKSINANDKQTSESQATSLRRTNLELLQYYLDLPPNERDSQFVDVSRAALLTGISQRTIQRWAKQRRIPTIFIAEKYKIEINCLYNYIKQRAWSRGE